VVEGKIVPILTELGFAECLRQPLDGRHYFLSANAKEQKVATTGLIVPSETAPLARLF
jgi:hypothetical protein